MSGQWLYTGLIVLVGLERLAELFVARRNQRWSMARGGIEFGREQYPPMVLLHIGLLAGCVIETWVAPQTVPLAFAATMLVLTILSQALRWWCIATLGHQWNTRVIVVPGLPAIASGPYRFMKHPNYVAVIVEGIALPLIAGNWITCVVFTALNAIVLTKRIRVENQALKELTAHG